MQAGGIKRKPRKTPFILVGNKLTHRNAKGSKLRYQLDDFCQDATIQELELRLPSWDKRAKNESDSQLQREYRTCCQIIRDWKRYKEVVEGFSSEPLFDTQEGFLIGEKVYSVEYSQDMREIIVRDDEGNIVERKSL